MTTEDLPVFGSISQNSKHRNHGLEKENEMEVVKSTSLSLCPCSVCVIVINQNCQKRGHFRVDAPFFKADAPFFTAGSFLPYFICIGDLPVM